MAIVTHKKKIIKGIKFKVNSVMLLKLDKDRLNSPVCIIYLPLLLAAH